ncbi:MULTISPECIES: GGDEF domain-containing protein [Thioclava]|uniref:diguanylate cyclase n=1 Tax=Thioclava litoralis TaxID=3076557 RepID=A0ABZ1DYX8_9RHOB|nr:GGDEF domain-containing protein [Thioclava sp. FTW29]
MLISQMETAPVPRAPTLSVEALGQLMPMFLWLDGDGTILGMGPTLMKVVGGASALGHSVTDCFQMGRGRTRQATFDISPSRRIHLTPRSWPDVSLRGVVVPIVQRGVMLNLTFGVHLNKAIRAFRLTEADFSTSDLTMELLYLQEAKTAVLGELRALNHRLERARRSAEDAARTDPLTGLSNRRAFDIALEASLEAGRRGGAPFALAQLDLDHFKAVNDTLGHAAGDHVLAVVAKILREETREMDVVSRVGGDEFVMLLRDSVDPERLRMMGARIIARLEEPIPFEGHECRISGSIGVAMSQDYDDPVAEEMMADADAALYTSKREGRARCTLSVPGSGGAS